MTGGTPCDLRGDNPRSVSILYICQTDAPTFGMVCVCVCVCACACACACACVRVRGSYLLQLLLVEESTSCHYVAIVGTKQLCQNKAYRYMYRSVCVCVCMCVCACVCVHACVCVSQSSIYCYIIQLFSIIYRLSCDVGTG